MIDIKEDIKDFDINQWKELIQSSLSASFFQTKECYDFYLSLSFLQPFILGVSENNKLTGIVCGYIVSNGKGIKKQFSKRAIIPGGVLLDKNISELALQKLLERVICLLGKEVSYIEIRNYNDYSKFKNIFEKSGFTYKEHLNYQIDFSNEKYVFENLSKSKQRQIKIAHKNGVIWEETKDLDDIRLFYDILKKLYKNKIRLPLFPIEFFEKLIRLPHGKLLVVKQEEKVIGGMACVMLGNNILYEWFVCGDENVKKHYYPSVMATWAGIKYAEENNYKCFDFMGAGKPGEDYGVRNFKGKFGGNLVQHGRFLHTNYPLRYKLGYMFVKIKNLRK